MKTVKIAEIFLGSGYAATCIKHTEDRTNPYWLYLEWYNMGKHRKLIAKYADMVSVLCHITNYYRGEATPNV